jgi:two-component system sensor histidine kinase UhpB
MRVRPPVRLSLLWRVFAINAALLVAILVVLVVTPVTVSAPIKLAEVLVLVLGLALTLIANLMLLRRAFAPLERLARRMDTVDLLRPGQRVAVSAPDEIGRLVGAFNAMLDRLEAERRDSGRRALEAQEAERQRIARGLHDEVGQVLTGVLLQLDAAAERVDEQGREDLAETKGAVRQALEEVRRISRELRPEMLEHLGLTSALTELARTFGRLSGVEVEHRFARDLPTLSPETELALFRIAQESLTNIARHAGASRVEVSLEPRPERGTVVLRVVDDGRGFAGGNAPEGHGGLRGMRERALLVSAALTLKQAPDGGVEVRVEAPAAPIPEPAALEA